ncbi:glycerol-3-phosphate cytidylyltransferase [Peribacillus muralis]|uniref:glycerol-3-phosphate cytidylyltransferase n=1 Tax=Peribacillus muralis TaxID=264697 RepID=UPI0007097C59|nr:glycerol-3-phosphate cytidylyltransferase [Peribacillus muralis]MCK1994476.1 glycerol-3-phosphate cytidylyltransferase [Peribacillus muralis]MCK2014739.1 glycerol-3-phosphate cytidylyltransferase [Peribacillus muralis]
MKKVITYGTFDLLHWGHINLLKRAKDLGDYLIVAISTDEFNALKDKKAYHSFENRKMILESIRYVDEVIPENKWEQKREDIIREGVDIFVMGDDWKGKFDELSEVCDVVYLPRTIGISTSQIKDDLLQVTNG